LEQTSSQHTALIVEDDDTVRGLLERWLTLDGYDVATCASFAAAKSRIAATPPDVLITDVRLGAFNGLQLAILAKQHREDTLAIVLTAFEDASLRREAALCGALYLLKPITMDQLRDSMRRSAKVSN